MDIVFEKVKSTGIIKLNRPKALNALNFDMSEKFSNQLYEWEKNDSIKQVLLVGEGNHFCAGGDVKGLVLAGKNSDLKKKFFLSEYKLNYQISNFPKPYLSIWKGVVMGGGVGLSIYGNYRIVTDTTKLAMPETAIGFFPDVGGSYFLSRLKYNYGLFLALTGQMINHNEILELGFGTHYCPNDQINNFIDKFIMNQTIGISDKIILNNKNKLKNFNLINDCFKGNIKDILEKLEKNNTEEAKKLIEIIKKKCPMSLLITISLLKKGSCKNLKECLKMEYDLCQNMVYRKDFDEGIDAVLISKHHNPKWIPKSINDIEKNDVNKLFEFNGEKLIL
tara:strand:+ start:450 stop:1454 length:1005 start_codon:yes stop_codon:yes gene_type:complete